MDRPGALAEQDKPFRFFDNRQKYLMFVTTCSEKWVIADRVSMEIGHLRPEPPALSVLDGCGRRCPISMLTRSAITHFSEQVVTNIRYFCRLSKKRKGVSCSVSAPGLSMFVAPRRVGSDRHHSTQAG